MLGHLWHLVTRRLRDWAGPMIQAIEEQHMCYVQQGPEDGSFSLHLPANSQLQAFLHLITGYAREALGCEWARLCSPYTYKAFHYHS